MSSSIFTMLDVRKVAQRAAVDIQSWMSTLCYPTDLRSVRGGSQRCKLRDVLPNEGRTDGEHMDAKEQPRIHSLQGRQQTRPQQTGTTHPLIFS